MIDKTQSRAVFHDYKRSLAQARQIIKDDPDLDDETKGYLLQFADVLVVDNLREQTIVLYVLNLQRLAKFCPPGGFMHLQRKDIHQIMASRQAAGISPKTITLFKGYLLRFLRWLREEYGYPADYPDPLWAGKRLDPGDRPAEFRGIKITMKREVVYKPEELPTQEDVEKMIDAAYGFRDRAIVAVLYESGARLGEFLGLTVGAVKHTPYGWKIHVDGKTGMRPIMLVNSAPYLTAWLSVHPFKEDPGVPLWMSTGLGGNSMKHFDRTGELLSIDKNTVRSVLETLAKRAGIKKRVNPHAFRHARATELARHLKESELRSFLGWTSGSNMPGIYVHLSARDTEAAILKAHGIETPESSRTLNQCRACPACAEQNPRAEAFCLRCGHPMELSAAQQADRAFHKLGQVLPDIMQNKKALRDFRRLLAKHKIGQTEAAMPAPSDRSPAGTDIQ